MKKYEETEREMGKGWKKDEILYTEQKKEKRSYEAAKQIKIIFGKSVANVDKERILNNTIKGGWGREGAI